MTSKSKKQPTGPLSLQITVTDRCNLQCVYCMPDEEIYFTPHHKIFQFEDLLRIVGLFVEMGGTRIHLIGGEPLLRKGLCPFIEELTHITDLTEINLTTNGVLLKDMASDLWKVGLRNLEVTIDSLDHVKYQRFTRGDFLYRVMDGLRDAQKTGFQRIKINTVIIKGFNNEEIIDFAMITKKKPYWVQFHEYLSADPKTDPDDLIPADGIKNIINDFQRLIAVPIAHTNGHTEVYRFSDGLGRIVFVKPVKEHACKMCRRLGITVDGQLLGCLHSDSRADLVKAIREGSDDRKLKLLMSAALRNRPKAARIRNDIFKACSRTP